MVFLAIEVARSKKGITFSTKYILEMLLGCRTIDTPMDPRLKLFPMKEKFWRIRKLWKSSWKTKLFDNDSIRYCISS